MKPRAPEAARLEADYLARVRAALAGRPAPEIDEVLDSVREHIEEELSQDIEDTVSPHLMASVLERLGPPEAYMQEESAEPPAKPTSPPRTSRKAIVGMLIFPASIVFAAFLCILLAVVVQATAPPGGALVVGPVLVVIGVVGAILGVVFSFSALAEIRHSAGQLQGRAFAWIGIVLPMAALLFLVLLLA